MNRRYFPPVAYSLAAAVLALACGAGSIRPGFAPFRNAVVDTINAAPNLVIQDIAQRLIDEGMDIQWQSPEEGYLETQWYNVVTRQSGGVDTQRPEQTVLLRFWADPAGETRTQVTGEAVFLQTTDPSVLQRDAEAMVPPGHAGFRLVGRAISEAKQRFGG